MSDNKIKVIGVRFDDSTLKRLKDLAEVSHDTISGIVRRATMYCLPLFEAAPVPVCQPVPEPPEQVSPDPVPVTQQPDILNVILKGVPDGRHAGNESKKESEEVA